MAMAAPSSMTFADLLRHHRVPAGAALPWWIPVGSMPWWLSLGIIPLPLTIAVLRFRLFDLDVLIRQTLVYETPSTILGAVYVAVGIAA
jgi:hypothetical protein